MTFRIPSNYSRTIISQNYIKETQVVDINSFDFKSDYRLTLSSFAKEISNFNDYSFPEKTRKLGSELLSTFNKINEDKKHLEPSGKNPSTFKSDSSQKIKLVKSIKSLQKNLSNLYQQIQKDIIQWFRYTVPADIKIAWPGHGL